MGCADIAIEGPPTTTITTTEATTTTTKQYETIQPDNYKSTKQAPLAISDIGKRWYNGVVVYYHKVNQTTLRFFDSNVP